MYIVSVCVYNCVCVYVRFPELTFDHFMTHTCIHAFSPNKTLDGSGGTYDVHVVDSSGCNATMEFVVPQPDPLSLDESIIVCV